MLGRGPLWRELHDLEGRVGRMEQRRMEEDVRDQERHHEREQADTRRQARRELTFKVVTALVALAGLLSRFVHF